MKEFIICSAVHVHSGTTHRDQPENITEGFVVCGRRHGDCYQTIENLNPSFLDQTEAGDQGFLTNSNRFVLRKEGLTIAQRAGQLLHPEYHAHKEVADTLYLLTSEDLFPYDKQESYFI
jgi:hypothetical protein